MTKFLAYVVTDESLFVLLVTSLISPGNITDAIVVFFGGNVQAWRRKIYFSKE